MKRVLFAMKWVPLFAAVLFLTACAPTLTNLTPTTQLRNASGVYPFEVMWSSHDATIRTNTIQPFVVVGLEQYPMRQSPRLPKRWEAAVPISGTNQFLNYRYKFDYLYNSIGQSRGNSRMSAPYQLEVINK